MQIKVNGQPIGELQSSREWNTWDITIPGSLVKDGVNEIVLRWPIPAFPGLTPLNRVVDDLAERLYPEFYCPFGEIHSFVATDAVADLNPAGRVSFKQELTEVQ